MGKNDRETRPKAVEGEAPSGFASGGGDVSPYKIGLIRDKVKEKFGITLETEVHVVGEE